MTFTDYTKLIPPPNSIQPKFMAWQAALLKPFLDTQTVLNQVLNGFNVNDAVGNQLDILGELLGRGRITKFSISSDFNGASAIPIRIIYDTPGQDLIIATSPRATLLVGLTVVNNAPFRFTLKSNTTVLFTQEYSSFNGPVHPFSPVNPEVVCGTESGEALIMNCDRALPPFTVYIIEV
jgi:hypothetical protein